MNSWRLYLAGTSLLVIAALPLGACGSPAARGAPSPTATASSIEATKRLSVLTTVYPLQYLAQRVGGDRVEVVNLIPAGAEPHGFEPSPRDVASIYRGDVFVYNGASFEEWVNRIVRELPSDGPIVVDASEGLELLTAEPHEHESIVDPHLWQDPHRYGQQAELIWEALVKADPADAAVYNANLDSLKKDLDLLRAEIEQGLASCVRDTIIVSHAAFGYLAESFGLRQIAITGISPMAEPSPARLRQLIDEVKKSGVTHIFFEQLVSPAVAETIAREVGAQTLVLHPLGGLTRAEVQSGEDYFTIMRKNLANLRISLGCR